MRLLKDWAKRWVLKLGTRRVVGFAVELLRAAEVTYSAETLDYVVEDIYRRTRSPVQTRLLTRAVQTWNTAGAHPPQALRLFRYLHLELKKFDIDLGEVREVYELGSGDTLCMGTLIAASGPSYVGSDPWKPIQYAPLYHLAERYFAEHADLNIGETFTTQGEEAVFSERVRWEADSKAIPSSSAGFSFSFAVLEHVRDPAAVVAECFRIAEPGSFSLHSIDYEDHRDKSRAWDFLCLSTAEWDAIHVGERARDYTNRVRHSAWRKLFEVAGFEVVDVEAVPGTPPPGLQVHSDLLPMCEEDLVTRGGVFFLRRPLEA